MKNELLDKGIILPSGEINKDKINLVAGAIYAAVRGNGMGNDRRRHGNRKPPY